MKPIKPQGTEAQLHKQVAAYIKMQYPGVMFNSDMAGVKLTMRQAVRAAELRSNKGQPDMVIYVPKYQDVQEKFSGALFIELKRKGTKIRKRDGSLVSDKHIQEQEEVMKHLRSMGYVAEFACGFEEAKSIIDKYLDL
jgi:hypothetical protein